MNLHQIPFFFGVLLIACLTNKSSSFSLPASAVVSKNNSRGRMISPSKNHSRFITTMQAQSNTFSDDIVTISMHIASCIIFASVLTVYEGYDCSYLKPLSATIRNYPEYSVSETSSSSSSPPPAIIQLMNKSTRGMGRGAIDRTDGWYQDTYDTSRDSILVGQDGRTARDLPSYNEIMLQHRTTRVPSWRQDQDIIITKEDVMGAVESIVQALETINQLKLSAAEYEWDQMLTTLQEPALTTNLQSGCSLLQRSKGFLSSEIRQEIGFDWGSCAWRHCAAEADAQESLAELYNSIGLFEPFECLFTLDIVERSLRDIMTVIPEDYKPSKDALVQRIGDYVPYQSKSSVDGDEDGVDSIDRDFLDALAGLRSDNTSFDDDDDGD